MSNDRRRFLWATAVSLAGLPPLITAARGDEKDKKEGSEDDVSPPEDLMREHGMLNRVLLVYEEGLRRLRNHNEDVGPEVFQRSATLIRKFVEDYHEKDEERFIFPEFEKRNQMVELVKVLRKQHEAGRAVTDVVLRAAQPDAFRKEENRKELVTAVEAFIRMYRPHETREDTVLFPALRKLLPEKQMKEIGEKMEESEKGSLGDEGFEKAVEQVAAIEKQLGIYELDQFTPKASGK